MSWMKIAPLVIIGAVGMLLATLSQSDKARTQQSAGHVWLLVDGKKSQHSTVVPKAQRRPQASRRLRPSAPGVTERAGGSPMVTAQSRTQEQPPQRKAATATKKRTGAPLTTDPRDDESPKTTVSAPAEKRERHPVSAKKAGASELPAHPLAEADPPPEKGSNDDLETAAGPARPGLSASGLSSPPSQGELVGKAAEHYLGASRLAVHGTRYRYDCSGLVMAAYARAGIPLVGHSASFFAKAKTEGVFHRRQVPRVGDVAFFDNTHDLNGNGRADDRLTHVAVVTAIDGNGTATLVHKSGRGVVALRMNLRTPNVYRLPDGSIANGYLRRRTPEDGSGTRHLSGQLWVGFASLWKPNAPMVARL